MKGDYLVLIFKSAYVNINNMGEEKKYHFFSGKSLFYSGFLAAALTLFDYFYLFLNRELGLSILDIAQGTGRLLAPKLLEIISDNFAVLPLVFFWVLVGVIAYFFYFSLEVVYYDISLYLRLKKIPHLFGGLREPRSLRIFLTRLAVHLLVANLYLLFLITAFFFIVPMARALYLYLDSLFRFPIAFLGPFAFWWLAGLLVFYLYQNLTASLKEEEVWEEHNLAF